MNITIIRKYKKGTYTIGELAIDGVWFCNTLEDKDRGLKKSMTFQQIRELKVYGETAIPAGDYIVRMDIVSPKYQSVDWYRRICGGKMPRVMDVPCFDGILFHPGNTAVDTNGCILVGLNTAKGRLTSSKDTFTKLYQRMASAYKKGETIHLRII